MEASIAAHCPMCHDPACPLGFLQNEPSSITPATPPDPLARCSNEVILLILEASQPSSIHVRCNDTLLSWNLTCKRIHELAEQLIYQEPVWSSTHRHVDTIQARPCLGKHVRRLHWRMELGDIGLSQPDQLLFPTCPLPALRHVNLCLEFGGNFYPTVPEHVRPALEQVTSLDLITTQNVCYSGVLEGMPALRKLRWRWTFPGISRAQPAAITRHLSLREVVRTLAAARDTLEELDFSLHVVCTDPMYAWALTSDEEHILRMFGQLDEIASFRALRSLTLPMMPLMMEFVDPPDPPTMWLSPVATDPAVRFSKCIPPGIEHLTIVDDLLSYDMVQYWDREAWTFCSPLVKGLTKWLAQSRSSHPGLQSLTISFECDKFLHCQLKRRPEPWHDLRRVGRAVGVSVKIRAYKRAYGQLADFVTDVRCWSESDGSYLALNWVPEEELD